MLGEAITNTKSLDQGKLAEYMHTHPFKTIVGNISFGKEGEWSKARVLEVQWQGLTKNSIEQLKDPAHEVILEPSQYRTGSVTAPYSAAKSK